MSPTPQQAAPQASSSRPHSAASSSRPHSAASSSRPHSAASTARIHRSAVTFEESPPKDRTRSAPTTANNTTRSTKIAWNKPKGGKSGAGTSAAADTWSGSGYRRSKGPVSVTKESRRATSLSSYNRTPQQSKPTRPANNRPKTAGPQSTNRQAAGATQARHHAATQNRHAAPQAQTRYTTPPHSRNVVPASRYTTPPQSKTGAQTSSARRATSYSAFSTPQSQRPQSQRGTGGRRPPASPQDATASSYMSPREIEARIQETLSRYGL